MKLDINVFGYIIMGFVLLMCLKIYQESETFNLRCIVSEVDGNKYCVRESSKIQLVADLLARVTNKLKVLVEHLKVKYPERENVKRLVSGFKPKKIYEILPTSKYTAYSENKGEKEEEDLSFKNFRLRRIFTTSFLLTSDSSDQLKHTGCL